MSPKKIRLLVLVLLLLAAFMGLGYIMATPGLKPVVISNNNFQPLIVPEQQIHHMGTVKMDSEAAHNYVLYNKGGGILQIDDVDTSCGCTLASISKKRLLPGEFTRIHVTLDTSLKVGPTKKCITILSNDPKNPEYKLLLTANVLPDMKGHEKIVPKDPLVLFKGECATCHVDKGKGKVGKELFVADCAMCHGLNADGKKDVAPSLLNGNYHDSAFFEATRKIIAEGSPNKPTMPPFSTHKGGPLNDDEITSLMNFLRFQNQQAKAGTLESVDEEECGGLEKTAVKF